MTYCRNCGSPVEGRFCARCGTPAAGAAGSGSHPGFVGAASGSGSRPGFSGATAGSGSRPSLGAGPGARPQGLADNVASALAYIPLLGGLFFLFVAPYNQNRKVRFHAWQSLFLFAALFVLRWVLDLLLPLRLSLRLENLVGIAATALWIFLIYKAYNNEKVVLPVIGPLAEKQV